MQNEYVGKIEEWFDDRGLTHANPYKQLLKLVEEFGELAGAIARSEKTGNEEEIVKIKDSIGDMFVVHTGLLHQLRTQKPEEIPDLNETLVLKQFIYILDVVGDIAYELLKMNENHADDLFTNGFYTFSNINEYTRLSVGCLSEIAELYQSDLNECVEQAYNEIANRKGKTINGVFVKEADL